MMMIIFDLLHCYKLPFMIMTTDLIKHQINMLGLLCTSNRFLRAINVCLNLSFLFESLKGFLQEKSCVENF